MVVSGSMRCRSSVARLLASFVVSLVMDVDPWLLLILMLVVVCIRMPLHAVGVA